MRYVTRPAALALCIASLAMPATAQDDTAPAAVMIELNALTSNSDSCTLTFFAKNGHAHPIEKVVYETVLFDKTGRVDRLTLFDFGTLPAGRPRVRQFSLAGVACEDLGQILINGAHTCEAGDLAPGACEDDLILKTRATIEVIG